MTKRLLLLFALLFALPCFAQSPGVGLDQMPAASVIGDTGLIFGYQPGSGGSGATICARGWCPVAYTLLQIKTYIGASGAVGFAGITSGTNSTATMTVGSGATLTFSGAGIVDANEINGGVVPISAALLGTNGSGQPAAVTLVAAVNGGTGISNVGTANLGINLSVIGTGSVQLNASGTTNATMPVGSYTLGYQGLPPCVAADDLAGQPCPLTGSTTLTLTAVGKMISVNCGSACTITIPAQFSVNFPLGQSCMEFITAPGSAVVTVAVTTDAFAVPGSGGSTGNRTLTATSTNPAAMGVCKYLSAAWVALPQGGVTMLIAPVAPAWAESANDDHFRNAA